MTNLYEQEPNSRFIGMPLAVHLYRFGSQHYDSAQYVRKLRKVEQKFATKLANAKRNSKKRKLQNKRVKKTDHLKRKIREGNYFMRIGEPLAIIDTVKQKGTVEKIRQYMSSIGFFRSQVTTKLKVNSRQRGTITYDIKPGNQYKLDSISYQVNDQEIAKLIKQELENSFLVKGHNYNEGNLSKERDRIFQLVADNGYFDFPKQLIRYQIDTITLNEQKVLVTTIVGDEDQDSYQKYHLDSVIFTSSGDTEDITRSSISRYNQVTYNFLEEKYRRSILDGRLFIYPEQLYSRKNTIETQKQLSYLDIYKFVNINYDTTGGHFVANIFTSPLNKFESSTEVGFSIAGSDVLPGPFLNFSFKNRNIFNGLEILQLSGNFALDGIQNVSNTGNNYSNLVYGADMSITFPQILLAGRKLTHKMKDLNPTTRIALSFNYEDRLSEYERSRINASFTYGWQNHKGNVRYNLNPITVGSNNLIKIEDSFQDFLDEQDSLGNGAFSNSFESSFISTSSFEVVINKNQYGTLNRDATLIRFFAESGGNLINVLGENAFNDRLSVFRFLKFNADFRKVRSLNRKASIAYRINVGIANPYGSASAALPYEKYFYIGGSNSLRAWPARRLGPGGYALISEENATGPDEISYRIEQGGDVILEASFELRRKLIGFVDWAFFVDAGNIWLLNSDRVSTNTRISEIETNQENGKFRFNKFYREIAVGTGLGLRFDFSFLVFRLDGAIQVVDPAQQRGERFVLDDIDFKDNKDFIRNKTAINIGIGFPF